MNQAELTEQIRRKGTFLCVGLDPDLKKIPQHLLQFGDPIFEFNKAIIDATKDHCVAFKPNTAFFECLGAKGWESLQKTIDYIPKDILVIADAKRGDLGNTAEKYAEAFFETMKVDAITLSPYMGYDSIAPYLKYEGKWSIILVKTSNKGSNDFQTLTMSASGKPLYMEVIEKSMEWGSIDNTMFVVGANNLDEFKEIREIAPHHFFLVPGFGAQGGQLKEIKPYLSKDSVGILANYSRQIIYARADANFATEAGRVAKDIHEEMEKMLVVRY